jgi:O-succinylbenzoic acid--CoA ligase
MDPSGRLLVRGRADDVLISGGITVHPVEIENLIIRCPGVDDLAISASQDNIWGDLLVALYSGTASQDEIETWCRANLPSSQRPRKFIRVSELPRTSMGKLDRKGLKRLTD